MQTIHPFLWFDQQAHEAALFYTNTFKNSHISSITYYPEGGPMPAGQVMTVQFNLNGQDFTAINAGPAFKFNPSISFVAPCDNQEEIDYLWETFCKEGEASRCGWLTDKYGLSWQIVPASWIKFYKDADPEAASRAMTVMMTMQKLNIAELERAFNDE